MGDICLLSLRHLVFTARRFARAALAMAIPSVCLSVCLSVRPSATHRYCVKTTARSTVLFALSDSKNVSSFVETKKYSPGTTPSPEIFARTDLPPPDSSESWHLLPCSASTVRDGKRSPITLNKNSTRAFQRAINQGSTLPVTFWKMGIKCLNLSSFGQFRKYRTKSLLQSFIIQKCQRQSCSTINSLSSGINILAGDDHFPWNVGSKWPTPSWRQRVLTHFAL